MMKLTSGSIFRNDQRWYGFSCWSKLRYKTFEFCNEKKEKGVEGRRERNLVRQDNCETKKNVTERKDRREHAFVFVFVGLLFTSIPTVLLLFRLLEITDQKENENKNDNNAKRCCCCQPSLVVTLLMLLAEWTQKLVSSATAQCNNKLLLLLWRKLIFFC